MPLSMQSGGTWSRAETCTRKIAHAAMKAMASRKSTEGRLSVTDRRYFSWRQFLNPFAFEGLPASLLP